MTPRLMELLARMHEEQKGRVFPRRDLPYEFRDLYAEWVEYDGFVAGLAMSLLSGRLLSADDIGPFKSREYRELLRRLRDHRPDLAKLYAAEFDFLDEMVELMRTIIAQRRGGSRRDARAGDLPRNG